MKNAKIVENFINRHPSIKECMRKGLINYSSLARLILSHFKLGKKDFDATLVGSRRYAKKLKKKEYGSRQIASLRVLKKGTIAEIVIVSKQKNPGFGPHVYFLLEENEIKVENLQCTQKEVVILVKNKNLSKAVELLT